MPLVVFAARACTDSSLPCCLLQLCRSFSAELLSSQLAPVLYCSMGIFSSKYITLHLPLNFISPHLPISSASWGPSEGQPGIQHMDCCMHPQPSPIHLLLGAESAYHPSFQITEDMKQYWFQYQSLWSTTSNWFPVGLHISDPEPFEPCSPANFPHIS